MRTISDLRRANLLSLMGRGKTAAQFAKEAGLAPAHLSQITHVSEKSGKSARGCGDKLARKIEDRLGLEAGWLDTDHSTEGVPRLNVPQEGTRVSPCVDQRDVVSLAGLSPLHRAAVDSLLQICRNAKLSERECIALLDSWKDKFN